jgi:hypothetical protein
MADMHEPEESIMSLKHLHSLLGGPDFLKSDARGRTETLAIAVRLIINHLIRDNGDPAPTASCQPFCCTITNPTPAPTAAPECCHECGVALLPRGCNTCADRMHRITQLEKRNNSQADTLLLLESKREELQQRNEELTKELELKQSRIEELMIMNKNQTEMIEQRDGTIQHHLDHIYALRKELRDNVKPAQAEEAVKARVDINMVNCEHEDMEHCDKRVRKIEDVVSSLQTELAYLKEHGVLLNISLISGKIK